MFSCLARWPTLLKPNEKLIESSQSYALLRRLSPRSASGTYLHARRLTKQLKSRTTPTKGRGERYRRVSQIRARSLTEYRTEPSSRRTRTEAIL